MLDTAFGEIRRKLEYKCGRVIEVNPAYTSQRCSECGHTDKENRKTQVRFLCVSCGFVSNADTNAAINIRRLGWRSCAGRVLVLAQSRRTVKLMREYPMGNQVYNSQSIAACPSLC